MTSYAFAVSAHARTLRASALRLCRSPADADDLVQDALERGLKVFAGPVPDNDVKRWLLTALRNRFIDICRQRARRPRELPIDGHEPPAAVPDEPPVWAAISAAEVAAAVDRLGPELRAAYLLFVVEKRSYEEIAGTLGVPRATVGTRLLRARRRLRQLLAPGESH